MTDSPPLRGGEYLLALLLILPSLLSAAIARQAPPQVWLGIGITAEKDIPATGGTTAKSGLRIPRLSFNSPADKAGLIVDDLIVGADGRDFTAESSTLSASFPNSYCSMRRAIPLRSGLSATV